MGERETINKRRRKTWEKWSQPTSLASLVWLHEWLLALLLDFPSKIFSEVVCSNNDDATYETVKVSVFQRKFFFEVPGFSNNWSTTQRSDLVKGISSFPIFFISSCSC
ncbi:hypothetical protein S83_017585 [Arachis hypogaea]